ncbi:hypothetical protein BH24DEI1_BH24DEI1_01050 [soil metagenome]|nr:(2Fe-2S) ferredoxin domain-containing protein [Deinococcota bacterium]
MKKLEPRSYRVHVLICRGKSCREEGSEEVARALRGEVRRLGAHDIRISRSFCLGQCSRSCVVAAEGPKGARWWGEVSPKAARKLAAKLAKRAKGQGG